VSGVTLDKTVSTIETGGSVQLNPTVSPSDATNQNVTWSTSNPDVATVSSSGLVAGVATGTAVITVTTADGGKTATCDITVSTSVLPTSITRSEQASSVLVNGTRAYAVYGTAFKVIDISNPASPSLLGTVTHGFTDLRVEPRAYQNNIVWCLRSSSGGYGSATYISAVDVSNAASPVVRGSLTLQTESSLLSPYSAPIYNGYWLVHDYSRNLIYVINISNPDAPSIYSSWSVPNMVNGGSGFMLIEGNLLYLPCRENKTFRIYDLTDLTSVTQIGSVTLDEEVLNVVKIGSYVYTGMYKITAINVSDPTTPTIAGSLTLSAYVFLREINGQLFSFDGSTPKICSYSLADPAVPVLSDSSTLPIPSPLTSLALYPMSYGCSAMVGNYLVGGSYGNAVEYHALSAIYFNFTGK